MTDASNIGTIRLREEPGRIHALQQACVKAGLEVVGLQYVDAHQPSKNLVKHLLRRIKRPVKQIVYLGRRNRGFGALRLFAAP